MKLRAILTIGLALVLLVAACGNGAAPVVSTSTIAAASTTAPATTAPVTTEPTTTTQPLPSIEPIDAAGALAIEARPFPDWVTVAGDSAWVANVDLGVARYELASGALLGSVETGIEVCVAMDTGFDSLWVADCAGGRIVRIDLETADITAEIPVEGSLMSESSIGVTDDAVWVMAMVDGNPQLVRIDPATDTVSATFPAPDHASAVRGGLGGLWVSRETGFLSHLDPDDASQLAEIPVARGARFLAVGLDGVWVMGNTEAAVTRVDPATDTEVANIRIGLSAVQGGDIAVGGGFVWARVSDSLVAKIDPSTNEVVARYGPAAGSGSVAADDDAVWISAHDVFKVWRLPLTG